MPVATFKTHLPKLPEISNGQGISFVSNTISLGEINLTSSATYSMKSASSAKKQNVVIKWLVYTRNKGE